MAVVARKRQRGIVYWVATRWRKRVYWERSGNDQRDAQRLSERRKREVKAGTFQPPMLRAPGLTVAAHFGRWLGTRRTRSAASGHEDYHAGRILRCEWFGALAIEDVRPRHVIQLARELQAELAPKTVTSAISLLTVMFRDAVIAEVITASPVILPRGLLSKRYKPTDPYTATEVAALLALPGIHGALAHLAFYSGMRPGEIAGRRWRDLDDRARPLAAMTIATTYNDQPLKTDGASDKAHTRVLPVHPDLASALEEWRTSGWALTYAADPTQDDWILPSRRRARDRSEPFTRSGLLQLWYQACKMAGVTPRELRATRNTFVTFARRSSPRTDVIESFTHNAKGEMIDRYNRFQWAPRCDVMGALTFATNAEEVEPGASASAPRVVHCSPATETSCAACC